MPFNEAASGLREFREEKQALKDELSEILGFDIMAINKATPSQSADIKISLVEQTYAESITLDQPVFFTLQSEVKGWKAWLVAIENPIIGFFKKEDEWYVSGADLKQNRSTSPAEIRQFFVGRLTQAGINVEDLIEAHADPLNNNEGPN